MQWKFSVFSKAIFFYFTDKWYIFGHLVHLMVIWWIISRFGMLYREKSGNPASDPRSTPTPPPLCPVDLRELRLLLNMKQRK
jgi:hypothetical protein